MLKFLDMRAGFHSKSENIHTFSLYNAIIHIVAKALERKRVQAKLENLNHISACRWTVYTLFLSTCENLDLSVRRLPSHGTAMAR